MKKLLTIICSLSAATLFAQKQIVVNGNISGLKDQSAIFMNDANSPDDTIATAVVTNGTFRLTGTLREPSLVFINFADSKKKALYFLDNSNINMSGDISDVQKLQVTGSSTQHDFEAFQSTFNPIFARISDINQRINAGKGGDSLQAESLKLYAQVQQSVDEFITAHPASGVSPFLLVVTMQISSGEPELLERRFNKLDKTMQEGFYGKYLKETIAATKINAIGSEAADFTQNDVNGKPVKLSSFRGKYVLIDFWASWCGPCRAENPNVVATYAKFKTKNFTILGVSLDKAKAPWLKAIADDKLVWTQVSDLKYWQNEVAQKYKVEGIPQNFLVGPDGKIVAKNLRGPALEAKLTELLGK